MSLPIHNSQPRNTYASTSGPDIEKMQGDWDNLQRQLAGIEARHAKLDLEDRDDIERAAHISAEHDAVQRKIADIEASIAAAVEADRAPRQVTRRVRDASAPAAGHRGFGSAPAMAAKPNGLGSRLFAAAGRNVNERSEFRSFGEFVSTIACGHSHPGLFAGSGGMTEGGSGETGGFAVPSLYSGALWDAISERSLVLQMANVQPFSGSNNCTYVVFDDQNRSAGGAAGLLGAWTAEAETMTAQRAKLRQISLVARKLALLVPVSHELLSDALPAFETRIANAMAAAAARHLDYAFFHGTGVAQPLGIINAACTVSVAAEGGQSSDSVNWNNLVAMAGRMSPASFARASWFVHPSVIPQLVGQQIVFKDGATALNGALAPIATASDGSMSIMTRPVIVSEACSPVGDVGDVVFCDWGQYVVGLREQVRLDRSDGPYFVSDEVALRLRLRVDGQPTLTQAETPRGGGQTNSPFVTLASR